MEITDIVDFFITRLTDTSTAYIQAVSVALMSYIGSYMLTFIKISLLMLAVSSFFSVTPFSITDIAFIYLKAAIITFIALKFEYYRYIVDFFTVFPDSIASTVVSSFGGIGDVNSINTLMGEFIKQGLKAVELSFAKGGFFIHYFIGIVILASMFFSIAGLFVIVVLSKILLSIMLGIGPIFIVAKMFNTWSKAFDMWIQQCANFALIPVFGYAVAMFTMGFSKQAVDTLTVEQTFGQAIMLVFVALINWIAMKKAYELAASISSGFATSDEYRARRAAYDLFTNKEGRDRKKRQKEYGRQRKIGGAKIV